MIGFFLKLKKNIIFKNFSYLSVFQFINLLFPLLTYPYLIRTLGNENYGLIAFATSIVSYISIIINFGFNITATKDIAINRADKEKINTITSAVFIIKTTLFLICYLIFSIIISFTSLKKNLLFFLLMGLITLNDVFLPIWFFQGLEKLRYISNSNFLSKLISLVLIFLFIRNKEGYIYYPLIQLVSILVVLMYLIYIIIKKHNVKLSIPQFNYIINYAKNSLPFFTSRLSYVITTESNNILIGIFLGYKDVAYYDLGKKIVNILLIPFNVLNDALYPNIARSKNMVLLKKILKFVTIISIIIFVLLFLFSSPIIKILAGSKMLDAKFVLQILGLLIPLNAITFFLGNTGLVVMDKNHEFNFSIIIQLIIFVILTIFFILFNKWSLTNCAIIIVISTLAQVVYRYYKIKKFRII